LPHIPSEIFVNSTELMATPAFIYAFDDLGTERFVTLCGLLLGARCKGFMLTSPGPDGGVDAENCPVIGEFLTESSTILQDSLLQSGRKIVFQFKHKVVARVGEANSRTQLLQLFRSAKMKKSEVLGSEIIKRNPDVYILVTNVEINSGFRSNFADICRKENSDISDYQVIGIDELEAWITEDRQLRSMYFPTIFAPARFNLALKFVQGDIFRPVTNGEKYDHEKVLCLTVMNIGEATSYLSKIQFKIFRDGKVLYLMNFPHHPCQIDPLANPKFGEPIEPGRSVDFRFFFAMFQQRASEDGAFFLDSVIAWDQIDNMYSIKIGEDIRELLFGESR
jgi:hypothetical protein